MKAFAQQDFFTQSFRVPPNGTVRIDLMNWTISEMIQFIERDESEKRAARESEAQSWAALRFDPVGGDAEHARTDR